MVLDGYRQVEGQHRLKVHRPDADAHRTGAADQPRRASPAACGGYASRKIERGIGRSDGYQYRASHLAVVVGAGQGLACRDHHKRSPLPVWVSLHTLRTNPQWIVRPRTPPATLYAHSIRSAFDSAVPSDLPDRPA